MSYIYCYLPAYFFFSLLGLICQESIEIFKKVLETNVNKAECHRSLGHAYRWVM